ncbi:hypothetical protein D3C71_2196490 [compost metagenome]
MPACSWLPCTVMSPSWPFTPLPLAVMLRLLPAVRLLPCAVLCPLFWVEVEDWVP